MSFLAVIRNAATTSVRPAFGLHKGMAATATVSRVAFKRTYATENGKEEAKPEEKEQSAAPTTEDLVKQLAEKDKKLAELQDAYLRTLADQENLRERSRKEIASTKEFAIQKFAKDLLDTVDILNMALASVPTELRSKETALGVKDVEKLADQFSNLYTGVSMTETELVKTLKRHGVEQDNPEGEAFDPNKHQALFQAPMPDKEAGTIFAVQKMGYMIKGRVLRPAQVGVVAETQ
ncbi:Mitochondrial matrix cochaperone [Apophysomyces sp. BC1034]|nr:Mitochondrial matrix cochaperone [Apophysomyces sp. BC1015]KAG0178922.1 Mitochondrial matrix cochaperone [Apophysomyces sp. BC1021]KAG0189259.1 Mitochondrial matrix cochaperone [Apophysomyces sp. BC1034]